MLKKYITLALRHAYKQKFHTTINVVGLAVGLATSLFITWYVMDELSYDQFHQDAERVFRITTNSGKLYHLATTPARLAPIIEQDIPEVEAVARVFSWNHSTMRLPDEGTEKVFRETSIYIADSTFLDVLDFNIIAGDTRALDAPNSLVLTKATAERYFGTGAVGRGEVLGKEILFGGNRTARVVSGVVDPPSATHFPFDMLVPTTGYDGLLDGGWGWNFLYTYLKVKPDVAGNPERMASLASKLDQIVEQHVKPALDASGLRADESTDFHYQLQSVTDIHLHSNLSREHQANGNIATVYTLSMVAVLILLLACINFMNLSTAQASRRAKEVGVRRVLGSARQHLILQFLFESLLITLIAGLLALGTVEVLRVPFNILTGKELSFDWMNHPILLLSMAAGVFLVGLLAGSYPAFYLSAFRPAAVLKGNTTTSLRSGKLRNLLIVFQFAVSISLIITTGLVVKQLQFIQTKDLGYDRENVLVIKNDKEIQDSWLDFKSALLSQSNIKHVSFNTGVPSQPNQIIRDIHVEKTNEGDGMHWFLIDSDYVTTLGLELASGRNFEAGRIADREGVLLNEAAARFLGLTDPIGKTIIKNRGADDEERLQVLGIIKDFHTQSFYKQIKPIAFGNFSPSFISDCIAVRFNAEDLSKGIEQVEEVWAQFEPDNPLVYSFLDQDFDRLFRAEQRLGKVFSVFTGLAFLVACLGLLGLASFVASQRTKEIGIRKVLGASVQQITYLLSKDFLRLVLIAFVVAIPVSYWLAIQWLENFVYRAKIGVGIFVLAGIAAVLIAWFTVSFQSIKAALANPVDSLRDE
ncbi:MAG: ABC transporter permease [Cyclobacteriaceae bacterium]